MKKFVVLYESPAEIREKWKDSSPEDHKKGMEAWFKWKEECGDNLVDFGNPVAKGQIVSKDGKTPTNDDLVGYAILQAESLEEAEKLVESHPHLEWGTIKVYETMPLPQ